MNVTSVRSTTRFVRLARARRRARGRARDVGERDLAARRRRRSCPVRRSVGSAPAPATRGGARRARCPSAPRTGRRGTGPSRPGPRASTIGRSGSSKPGPVVEHAQVHAVARRAAARPRPCRPRRRCGGRRWPPARWPAAAGPRRALAELGASGASASATSCAAARRGRRSARTRAAAAATCSARQAMSSRGLPSAFATAVRSRCSTTARGPSAALLGDERGEVVLGQDAARRGRLAHAVGVEDEQVAGAELGRDLGQLGPLDDAERRADVAERRGAAAGAGEDRERVAGGRRARSARRPRCSSSAGERDGDEAGRAAGAAARR